MSGMSWVDLVIVGIFFFSVLAGLIRGFMGEVISLLTLIACFAVATFCANPLAQMIISSPTIQNMLGNADQTADSATKPAFYIAIGISFIIVFIATMLVGSLVKLVFSSMLQGSILGFGNRLLGAVFGLVRGFILNLILIFLIQLTSFTEQAAWQQSLLVPKFEPAVMWVNSKALPTFNDLKQKFGVKFQQKAAEVMSNVPDDE